MRKTIVPTAELARQLPVWRVFDCRFDLMKPASGAQQYAESHIPGASFADLEKDLSAQKTGRNGRHPLPQLSAFTAWLGQQGLRSSDQVVCYDAGNGMMAARLWWMLRWAGHEAAAVLDGGFAKWQKEGRPVTTEAPDFRRTEYVSRESLQQTLPAARVEAELSRLFLLDARAPARYRGEQEPIDPVAGHIPGARNRFNMDNVLPDGSFKPAEQLRSEFQAILGEQKPGEVVHYCGSGVSACHNLLAMEVAGLHGGRLFAGSWSEWIAESSRPREP